MRITILLFAVALLAVPAQAGDFQVAEVDALRGQGNRIYSGRAGGVNYSIRYPPSWQIAPSTTGTEDISFHAPSRRSSCTLRFRPTGVTDINDSGFATAVNNLIQRENYQALLGDNEYAGNVPVRVFYYIRSDNAGLIRTEKLVLFARLARGNLVALTCGVSNLPATEIDQYYSAYIPVYRFMAHSIAVW